MWTTDRETVHLRPRTTPFSVCLGPKRGERAAGGRTEARGHISRRFPSPLKDPSCGILQETVGSGTEYTGALEDRKKRWGEREYVRQDPCARGGD